MSTRSEAYLFDLCTREYVDAILIDGVSKEEIEVTENTWRPVMDEAVRRKKEAGQPPPQHAHWDWRKKHAALGNILSYQFLGIECAGQMQGLMLLQTANVFCRLQNQAQKGLVYVYFIATAPWNSPEVVEKPLYGQVGTVLISAAIQISMDLDFKGRIGLHSLRQSEVWYGNHCGMTDLGVDPDPKRENMHYFEMTAEQAVAFLHGGE